MLMADSTDSRHVSRIVVGPFAVLRTRNLVNHRP